MLLLAYLCWLCYLSSLYRVPRYFTTDLPVCSPNAIRFTKGEPYPDLYHRFGYPLLLALLHCLDANVGFFTVAKCLNCVSMVAALLAFYPPFKAVSNPRLALLTVPLVLTSTREA